MDSPVYAALKTVTFLLSTLATKVAPCILNSVLIILTMMLRHETGQRRIARWLIEDQAMV